MLIICHECGKEVSDQARACPGCGAKFARPILKREIGCLQAVLWLIVLAFAWVAWRWLTAPAP
jgi:DNA-directed RNA polymerase subunit RPC12/RpoP